MKTNVNVLIPRKLYASKIKSGGYSCEHVVIGTLLFVVVLLGALVGVIAYVFVHEVNYTIPLLMEDVKLQTLSVYCEDLALSPDEDFETFVTKKNRLNVSVNKDDKYICTGNNLTSILQQVSRYCYIQHNFTISYDHMKLLCQKNDENYH